MKNEETLALILEEINKKLDVIINEQKDIKEKIEKKSYYCNETNK